ncbi:unnamed protein product [Mesocestoides corti]|uniref:FMP27/BLTP2/Hobbit GFWDK motif-containing RBG unit domain-containing protein n=1 Tax=Mesocestoides corti TaxID=53468 RepID=A0A158QV06_MESCO|nr:unnamed protein product [Mesocestoides corti]
MTCVDPSTVSSTYNRSAFSLLLLENLSISFHRFRREILLQAGKLTIKPLVAANYLCDDDWTCAQCGETYCETLDDVAPSSTCWFCRRSHLCGTFVAVLSTAIMVKISLSASRPEDKTVGIKFYGVKLIALESTLNQFERAITSDLPTQDFHFDRPRPTSPQLTSSKLSINVDFLPSASSIATSGSDSSISVSLLRQPLDRSLSVTLRRLRGSLEHSSPKTLDNVSLSIDHLKLTSGCIPGPRYASREFLLTGLDLAGTFSAENCECVLSIRGAFFGLAHDVLEEEFFASLLLTAHSIALSHHLISNLQVPNSRASFGSWIDAKSVHVLIRLEQTTECDFVMCLAHLPAPAAAAAVVQSFGPSKLDLTLPGVATGSFSFVLETASVRLEAHRPRLDEPSAVSCVDDETSIPISDVFVHSDSTLKTSLIYVDQLSAWCHTNVIGFRISGVEVEVVSALVVNFFKHLPEDAFASGGGHARTPKWLPEFSTPNAAAFFHRFTLDGHFESMVVGLQASCGPRIVYSLATAHSSASPLPRCSPSRSSSLSARSASRSHQPLFLEFSFSRSEFIYHQTSATAHSLLTLPSFQVCCNVGHKEMEVFFGDAVDLAFNPGVHLCVCEFLLLLRVLRLRHSKQEAVGLEVATFFPPSLPRPSAWNVEVHNTAHTRLTYASGRHVVTALFSSVDALLGNSPIRGLALRLTSSKLVVQCDNRDIAVLQVGFCGHLHFQTALASDWSRDTPRGQLQLKERFQAASRPLVALSLQPDSFLAAQVFRFNKLMMAAQPITAVPEGRAVFEKPNLVLRRLPPSSAHRKVAFQLTTPENTCLEFHTEGVRITFPYNYKFSECFDEFVNVRRMHKLAASPKSAFFADIKQLLATSSSGEGPSSRIPCDYVIRVKKFTLEIKDDPFECKLSDDFMVLMDESVEQQKRVAALTSQLERSRHQNRGVVSEVELQSCLKQLEFQRAAEYIARIRRFYSGYTMADDLFTWSMDSASLHVLADEAYNSSAKVIAEIQRIDDVSPWNDLQASDFTQLCCRRIHLSVARFCWQLRDYSKPLIDAADLTVTGPFAVAIRKSVDRQGQRDREVTPGVPWDPPVVTITRHVSPVKFFYELVANMKELFICYGSNWEPAWTWLNLRLDGVRRVSMDPSLPPLGWWDRVRLNYHGRLAFTCDFMSWLYPTSLDPYNNTEFLTFQWTRSMFDWTPGRVFVNGDLDLFFQTASKYDGICHVLEIQGLNFEATLDWLSFGNQFDHHAVVTVNGKRLSANELATHDSFKAFRGNRLLLRLAFTLTDQQVLPPRCFIYTNLLKLFDRLKMCLSRIARPIRRGPVFRCIRPRKPLFGHLLQCLELSVQLPRLEVTYWVSYAMRLGVHARMGAVTLRSLFRVHVEGERETMTVDQKTVYVLPTANQHRRISPQWSLQVVDARVLNCRAWLLHQPDRTALHLISAGDGNAPNWHCQDANGLPTAFPPNSELLTFSSVRFERDIKSRTELPVQEVRVRIPGLEERVVVDEHTSSNSPDHATPGKRRPSRVQFSHEDLEPVHRVLVENPKMRWNETNRNLVYAMMNIYNHAQALKKNLSAQALKGISLSPDHTAIDSGNKESSYQPVTNSISENEESMSLGNDGIVESQTPSGNAAASKSADLKAVQSVEDENSLSPSSSVSRGDVLTANTAAAAACGWKNVPMLARLIEEAETAKFYAYCEEEPKQPDVLDQLQGLSLCTSCPVLSRQWHIELINTQVMLKPSECAGYVIVSAAKARLDSVEHPPVWRDARLLAKSSLVGQMECMQYYATVGGLDASTPDQWLSTADVRDWQQLGTDFGQDALSGRPEVVGSGHAVGGVVSAAPTNLTASTQNIQLQRMVSRCACQFVYVTYTPVEPDCLPSPRVVPPLPPEDGDSKILQNQEGADTFTLLHRTLNLCTNSLQYSMVFDIVNNLLLYVEPKQKERFERNRVGLSLLDERELRKSILTDQETLRAMVNMQRAYERDLWALLREFDQLLRNTQPTLKLCEFFDGPTRHLPTALSAQTEQILAFEERIGQLKASIVAKNSLLSQSIAHFQRVHVQSQRLQGQIAASVVREAVGSRQRETAIVGTCNSNADTQPSPQPTTGLLDEEEIVRRDEVCFEHARWRMTELDGQIGLADVELRGFLYSRTHRRDVSGSHRFQLGSMRVQSLAPNSYFKEVLLPDTSSYHYTGGPMIRVACTQRPPVGGISVKEVMEISVTPLVLQVSKQFYNKLMPFFFPERGNEEAHHHGQSVDACGGDTADSETYPPPSGLLRIGSSRLASDVAASPSMPPDDNASADGTVRSKRERGGKLMARFDPKSWSGRLRPHSVRIRANDTTTAHAASPSAIRRRLGGANRPVHHHHPHYGVVGEAGVVAEDAIGDANLTVEQTLSVPNQSDVPSVFTTVASSERSAPSQMHTTTTVVLDSTGTSTVEPAVSTLPIDVMRGDKQKNLADVTGFELNIPMLEYHNRLWTWLDFLMEVKVRVRKQLIKEVIKQKLRPRRALSWHNSHSALSDRVPPNTTATTTPATAASPSHHVNRHPTSTNSNCQVAVVVDESRKREQEVLELILGRHAAENPVGFAFFATSALLIFLFSVSS